MDRDHPLPGVAGAASAAAATTKAASASRLPRGRETVLLVEDSPTLRAVVGRVLESCGYMVVEAPDAEAALAVSAEHDVIHLLLSDVVLPGRSGVELARDLRTRRPGIKIVYMTGHGDRAAVHVRATGHGPLLEKPFTAEELANKLREVLGPMDSTAASSVG